MLGTCSAAVFQVASPINVDDDGQWKSGGAQGHSSSHQLTLAFNSFLVDIKV